MEMTIGDAVTSVAPLSPGTSPTASSVTVATIASHQTLASSLLAALSDHVPIAVEPSIPESSSIVTLSQLPPGSAVGGLSTQVSGAIIGAVVAAVVVLVVASVIVFASLIAWRVRRTGGKTFTGMHSILKYISFAR